MNTKKKLRIGIVCSNYPIENSPTVKGIATYLAEQGMEVDVLVNTLGYDSTLALPGVRVHRMLGTPVHPRVEKLFRPLVRKKRDRALVRFLRSQATSYDFLYAVEFASLMYIQQAQLGLCKTCYFSLEAESGMRRAGREVANALLSQCAMRVIQSPEREAGLNRWLGSSHSFEHLPVAMRPVPPAARRLADTKACTRLIHSGYFAEWSLLHEILDALHEPLSRNSVSVTLQGFAKGTEQYLQRLRTQTQGLPGVSFDVSFYDDREHHELLMRHDIGIACYSEDESSANWSNLINSSGKIATYLWAGLPIITNLATETTRTPPFLFLDPISPHSVAEALARYRADRETYHRLAYRMADWLYNLDRYMGSILERTLQTVQSP